MLHGTSEFIGRDLYMQRGMELWRNVHVRSLAHSFFLFFPHSFSFVSLSLFFDRICRSRTFFVKIMHRIHATYRVMHFVGMFDFASDTYFNPRGRRSKYEGWLFAGDQNLIFIQSGGQTHRAWGCRASTSPTAAFRFLVDRVFALSGGRIEKFAMWIFARNIF